MYARIFSIFLIVFLILMGCVPAPTPLVVTATATEKPAPTATVEAPTATAAPLTYPIVDTGQGKCYDANAEIPCPTEEISLARMPSTRDLNRVTPSMTMGLSQTKIQA